ncbi:MAG TPA: hypothetical protein V6D47_21995 [Oscillatoriaceae cyanobacterium]
MKLLTRSLLLGVLVGTGCAPHERASGTFDKRVPVDHLKRLVIAGVNGDIRLSSGPADAIVIHALKQTDAGRGALSHIQVVVSRQGQILRIQTQAPGDAHAVVDYAIAVPPGLVVGSAETENGNIVASGTPVARLAVENGTIRTQSPGLAYGKTENGDIQAELRDVTPDGLLLGTANGNISLAIAPSVNAAIEGDVDNGSVTVPKGLFTNTQVLNPTHLRGSLGKGGPSIALHVDNGDITLTKL